MTYYIQYRKMVVHPCVCLDVSSDDPADQMIYYIHYRKKDAPHYVCGDVSSDDSAD
jgi:hypothetical protein